MINGLIDIITYNQRFTKAHLNSGIHAPIMFLDEVGGDKKARSVEAMCAVNSDA